MDGLREQADVLFILTSNRADLLEPSPPGPGGSTKPSRYPFPMRAVAGGSLTSTLAA
jgi:hypothetical protein